MFARLRDKSRSLLGIDIGLEAIRVLAITSVKGTFCVSGYAQAIWPKAIDDILLLPNEVISQALNALLLKTTFPTKQVAIAWPDACVEQKIIQLAANLNQVDLEEAVWIAVNANQAHSVEETYVDFKVLGSSDLKPNVLDVLVVSANSQAVKQRVAAVNAAGLDVSIVDIESQARERGLRFNQQMRLEVEVSAAYTLACGLALCLSDES